MKRDIHQDITDRLIDALEAGAAPWAKSWVGGAGGALPVRACGTPYKGINVLLLWMASDAGGYASDMWMTFKQAKAKGGAVRKGEKSTAIVFFKTMVKPGENPGDKEQRFGFLKSYNVFNTDQIDGIEAPAANDNSVSDGGGDDPIESLESFFAATGAKINSAENISPHWNPATDTIGMPTVQSFTDAHAYYGTLAHELTHWTGHTPRLDRDMKYHTKEGRAFEELIAEIGKCFLCAHIGATPDFASSVSYVASWLKALRNDKRFIFRAATAAQAASDYALDAGGQSAIDIAA